jgi:hypothetical protein
MQLKYFRFLGATSLLALALAYYWFGYGYWSRPPFHNIYASGYNGLAYGPHKWQFLPTMVSDGEGGIMLPDFEDNMLVVLEVPKGPLQNAVSRESANATAVTMRFGTLAVVLTRNPNSLLWIGRSGRIARYKLEPNEAREFFDDLTSHRVGRKWEWQLGADRLDVLIPEYLNRWLSHTGRQDLTEGGTVKGDIQAL